jgi:cbb3-type cytochrome c oxidase subunit III
MRSHGLGLCRLFVIGTAVLASALALRAATEPDGAAIYKQKCAMCHGADGKGFPAIKSPDFTDPKWQESVTDKEMVDAIKDGRKGTPMPAFSGKLKDDEIQALVTFIRSFNSAKKK